MKYAEREMHVSECITGFAIASNVRFAALDMWLG